MSVIVSILVAWDPLDDHDSDKHLNLLLRWQILRQGPRGGSAGERGEAEPTVGVRAAVKTYKIL